MRPNTFSFCKESKQKEILACFVAGAKTAENQKEGKIRGAKKGVKPIDLTP